MLRPVGPWFLALALDVRAILAVRHGSADESIAIVRESLTLIRGLHDNHAFVFALGPLAVAAMLKGDEAWAARILGARDAVTERTRATVGVRQTLDNLMGLGEREVRARLGPEQWAPACGGTHDVDRCATGGHRRYRANGMKMASLEPSFFFRRCGCSCTVTSSRRRWSWSPFWSLLSRWLRRGCTARRPACEKTAGRALQGPRSAKPDRAATGGTQRLSRAERIVAITQAWCDSWTGAELIAALEKRGCLLARGDQRGLYRQGLQWRD